MFNSSKRELALLLTALAIAAGLMALAANFAFDRLSAGHLERHEEPKRSAFVSLAAISMEATEKASHIVRDEIE